MTRLADVSRFSHFKRNAGWGGVARAAAVLGVVTVFPSFMWATAGDWRGMPVVLVSLALPVLAREALVQHIERTESVLRYAGYSLMGAAFVFPFVSDGFGEGLGELVGAGVFAALSLYISTFVTALSDPRIVVHNELWR